MGYTQLFLAVLFISAVWGQCNVEYVHTWLGNTFAQNETWANYNISGFYAHPQTGYVVVNTPWDEGGREVGIYKDGQVVALAEYTHGWERSGGVAVTSDGTYVYFGTTQGSNRGFHGGWSPIQWPFPPVGETWWYVRRTFLNGTSAYYSNSSAYLAISTNGYWNVTGLAISPDGQLLYVARNEIIELHNTTTREHLATWTATNQAGQLALDLKGNLWVAPVGAGIIMAFSPEGKDLGVSIPVKNAQGIAVHQVTGQLLVVDQGLASRTVSVYNINGGANPTFAGSFGQSVFSNPAPGMYADNRFNNLVGVGSDTKGNMYIAMSLMGAEIRVFSTPSPTSNVSTLLWKIQGLEWLSTAHYDPVDDRIYGPVSTYTFRRSLVGNGTEWSLYSSSMDALANPWDPRANLNQRVGSTRIYHFGGGKFMSVTNMYVIGLMIYRFEGELAIPCAAISKSENYFGLPNAPPNMTRGQKYIWLDLNGNGYPDTTEYTLLNGTYINNNLWALSIDTNGTVWAGDLNQGVEAYYYNTLNQYGVPMWNVSNRVFWTAPKSILQIERVLYVPTEDTMYMTGPTVENNYNTGEWWGMVGVAVQKYENWTSSGFGPKVPTAEYRLPNSTNDAPALKSMDIYDGIFFGAHFATGQVHVIDMSNGNTITVLDPWWPQGLMDMPYSITVSRRVATGDWLIILEEDVHNKNTVYMIPGGQPCLPS